MTSVKDKITEISLKKLAIGHRKSKHQLNGYDVYYLQYERPAPRIGLPTLVLVKGEEVKRSTPQEYFDFFRKYKGE